MGTSSDIIDLRSDTLTRPTDAMRAAIANAEVGDDVFGEDPSINRLQARCAELAGRSASLFVPSGTMANLIACRVHTRPGDEVLLERTSHLYRYEAAGFAAVAGVSVALLASDDGLLTCEAIPGALRSNDVHQPTSRLLWLENTHNFGGGSYYSLSALQALRETANAHGLKLHIDGARVWNACVAAGYSLAEVAACCDSMSCCFSKGLGCPVGSILIGDADFIAAARRVRKMLGGGMRQAGHLASAANYALSHHVARLADDHRRAQRLADGLSDVRGLRPERKTVPTNILFLDTSACGVTAEQLSERLDEAGVRVIAAGPHRVRLVTHLDVSDDQVERAIEAFHRTLGPRVGRKKY
ncbi:MAG: low-specificity L-threonine aldolase [Myxococcales bacterium]|nr:low-specificity L-threonine aldolase [Myxococcales bacterium]